MVLSMDRWLNKVAIVTGAASGIGAAISEKLVKIGVNVVGLDLNPEPIEKLASDLSEENGKLHAVKVDLSKKEDIVAAFEWIESNLGPVHILINNAGTATRGQIIDATQEQNWETTFKVNVFAVCETIRQAVRIMKANGIDGHIVNVNSLLGHHILTSEFNVYPASKFAVTAITETVRQELASTDNRIKITSLSPGLVKTGLRPLFNPDFKDESVESEDIADALLYVLSTPQHVHVHELMVGPFRQ